MSATEVNGTAISTGAYPAHDGIIGNKEFRPDIDPLRPVHMEETDTVRKGDAAYHGNYIRVPTIEELLQKKGIRTVVAGAKPNCAAAGPRGTPGKRNDQCGFIRRGNPAAGTAGEHHKIIRAFSRDE